MGFCDREIRKYVKRRRGSVKEILRNLLSFAGRISRCYKEEGFKSLFQKALSFLIFLSIKEPIGFLHQFALNLKPSKFYFMGQSYNYFHHRYNHTWEKERTVEVPIIMHEIKSARGKRILEVGNVLSHYFSPHWDILDKYERAKGVINQDVVDFQPTDKYDLIVSISTLEHVGYDPPEVKQSTTVLDAIKNLKHNCLKPNGRIIVTLPLGQNREMDKFLFAGELNFDETYFIKRISKDNRWTETTIEKARNANYGSPFPYGNVLVIGIVNKCELAHLRGS